MVGSTFGIILVLVLLWLLFRWWKGHHSKGGPHDAQVRFEMPELHSDPIIFRG